MNSYMTSLIILKGARGMKINKRTGWTKYKDSSNGSIDGSFFRIHVLYCSFEEIYIPLTNINMPLHMIQVG